MCDLVCGPWLMCGPWSVVHRLSYVDNLVDNVLETKKKKIWKRVVVKCIFSSQD